MELHSADDRNPPRPGGISSSSTPGSVPLPSFTSSSNPSRRQKTVSHSIYGYDANDSGRRLLSSSAYGSNARRQATLDIDSSSSPLLANLPPLPRSRLQLRSSAALPPLPPSFPSLQRSSFSPLVASWVSASLSSILATDLDRLPSSSFTTTCSRDTRRQSSFINHGGKLTWLPISTPSPPQRASSRFTNPVQEKSPPPTLPSVASSRFANPVHGNSVGRQSLLW